MGQRDGGKNLKNPLCTAERRRKHSIFLLLIVIHRMVWPMVMADTCGCTQYTGYYVWPAKAHQSYSLLLALLYYCCLYCCWRSRFRREAENNKCAVCVGCWWWEVLDRALLTTNTACCVEVGISAEKMRGFLRPVMSYCIIKYLLLRKKT